MCDNYHNIYKVVCQGNFARIFTTKVNLALEIQSIYNRNMNFQRHCNHYLQQIRQTQSDSNATPELSLHHHLQAFLEDVTTDAECFNRPNITFTHEPRNIDQIGRPDFIAKDGFLPLGYIEAEADGTDLNNLTGHAAEQNERFKENLDNFILTNFIGFELWRDGQLRAYANIENETDNFKTLLEQFLDAGHVQIASAEALAKYLARRTRELQTQIATTLTDEDSETYRMFNAFKETLLATLTRDDFADMYAQTLDLWIVCCTLHTAECNKFFTAHRSWYTPKIKPISRPTLLSRCLPDTGDQCHLYSG